MGGAPRAAKRFTAFLTSSVIRLFSWGGRGAKLQCFARTGVILHLPVSNFRLREVPLQKRMVFPVAGSALPLDGEEFWLAPVRDCRCVVKSAPTTQAMTRPSGKSRQENLG